MPGTEVKRLMDQPELDLSVVPVHQQIAKMLNWIAMLTMQLAQAVHPKFEIDGMPVIRIHKPKIPEFGALIKVGDARAGDLEKRLAEAIDHSEESHGRMKARKSSRNLRLLRGLKMDATNSVSACSWARLGRVQRVCTIASRVAFTA